jgi:hypothetical protein
LPDDVGDGGDITDFFVRLGRSANDFKQLLDAAQPLASQPPVDAHTRPANDAHPAKDPAIQELKSRIGIADVVGRYIPVSWNGERGLARCPFHDDQNPSFVIYPQTESFHCFGCRVHGDVITFLMRIESLSFREAVDALRNLSN